VIKQVLLPAFFLLFTSILAFAQPAFGGLPLGIQQANALLPAPSLHLKGLDVAKLQREDEQNQMNRFAAPIPLDISTENAGNWTLLPDGTQVWQLRITVEKAQGLILFYEDFDLPAGSQLFVYSPISKQVLGAYTQESQSRSDRFLTGIITGNELIVEYQAPADNFAVPFHLWRIDAVYRKEGTEKELLSFGFGSSSDCHDNVVCPAGDEWQAERNAVARIIVVVEEGTGYCTGTLLNNTAQDGRLLFLSAFHCMDGYTPLYDLWRFDFYFASETCPNPAVAPAYRPVLGCDSLAGRRAMDFLLLDIFPETTFNMELYFAGWDRSGTPPDSAAVLHHPRGDIQKISLSTTPATVFANSIIWNNGVTTPPNQHFRVRYSNGTIEVGSSGAALLDQHHRVVGQLNGDAGTTTCDNSLGFFGRLSMAWEGPDDGSRLKNWLDPLGTLPLQLDALAPIRSPLVTTDDEEPVAGVAVTFYLNNEWLATTETGQEGRLTLPVNLPAQGELRLAFTKGEDQYRNGVTTADLIRMQKHILGTDTMPPYKMLACDVNLSNSMTTLDMIRIRKLILTITPDFGDGGAPSWQFFVANPSFADPLAPWPTAVRDNSITFNLNAGFSMPDFVAVKTGDANGNANAGF